MTPPVSPIREPFDVPYETGFPSSEGFGRLISTHSLGSIDTENRPDLPDRLTDATTIKIAHAHFIGG